MAAKEIQPPTPLYCIQHRRFNKPNGWQLCDVSVSLNGNIAVTSLNDDTKRTSLNVYSTAVNSNVRDKPKNVYSREFGIYSDGIRIFKYRYLSFADDEVLVSCLGYELEVFKIRGEGVLRSRKMGGSARCVFVREKDIFVGFGESTNISVYNILDLTETRSINLQIIQDENWPKDIWVIAGKIFACVVKENNKTTRIFEEKNGRILSELTKPTDSAQWYALGITVNVQLSVIAVAWSQTLEGTKQGPDVIAFYSLLSEDNCSFLIVEIEYGVEHIRMSARGDRMVTLDRVTEDVIVFDMATLFSYSCWKETLGSQLKKEDCVQLAKFFSFSKDQTEKVEKTDTPVDNLLLTLEEAGVVEESNVDRLTEAFRALQIQGSPGHLTDFYQKTRSAKLCT